MAGRDDPFVRADSKPPNRLLRVLRRHAWWILILAVVLSVLLAREAGLVDLERFIFTPKSLINIPSRTATSNSWKEGETFAPHPYSVEIDARGDDGVRVGVQEALKDLRGIESNSYGGILKIEVLNAEYSGRYWMPYKKQGRAVMHVRVTGNIENKKKRVAYLAEYEVAIDFTVEGLCSLRGLKRKLGAIVGGAINEDLSAQMLRSE